MHLTLINPPFIAFKTRSIRRSQCLGLLSIASYVISKGHEVTIIDAVAEGFAKIEAVSSRVLKVGLSNEEIIKRIPPKTDLIGASVPFSRLAPTAHLLICAIRAAYPETPIVMGGAYPSTQPKMANTADIDYLVLGEGELPTTELLCYLQEGGTGDLPMGVVSKDGDYCNHFRPRFVEDLDILPPPARELVAFYDYARWSQRDMVNTRTASIVTSRGCPFDCEFCSVHPICGYRWRPHSVEYVLEEIDHLIKRYAVTNIEIEDDNFTLDRIRAVRILQWIEEKNLGGTEISWTAPNGLRIDTLDETLISLMHRSNCRYIYIALEHGDEAILQAMNKRLDLAKPLEIARLMHKYKIPCFVFAMYGYPGENSERFRNAVSYYAEMKRLAPEIEFSFFVPEPYPGTALLDRVIQNGYLSGDLFTTPEKMAEFFLENEVWIETPDFDEREVRRRGRILMESFQSPNLFVEVY